MLWVTQVKKQALKQVVVNPVRTTIQTMSKKKVMEALNFLAGTFSWARNVFMASFSSARHISQ
jgi:hypothetical protein